MFITNELQSTREETALRGRPRNVFAERVVQLRDRLGLNNTEFCERIGTKKQVFSMWTAGKQKADRDTLLQMCNRWGVDMDSLWGQPGSDGLEPSPLLRKAQETILNHLTQIGDVPGSSTSRIVLLWTLLTKPREADGLGIHLPLEVSAWTDWLRWSEDDWRKASTGEKEVGEHQVDGAAFLLGWSLGQDAWAEWIKTGRSASLQPSYRIMWERLADEAGKARMDIIEIRRLILAAKQK
jgi:transcriptional regulator with XRE-family HTH domain